MITALHDDAGNLIGYTKVTRDRTDLKSLEDAQDAFYAAFSHDFRTPITALKGFVDAIRDAADEDEREHLIERVEASADRLLGMVEGLVQFATHRAERATLLLADIDIAQVVRAAVQDLPDHIGPGRIQVADDVAIARANGVAMHRVVTNLLVNALKYSPPDSPVKVDFSRPRPGLVRIAISDEGRGIDPGDVDTIFDEFVRGRLAEDDGGTGLGLASVRELVGQLEGSVAIETEVGVGTTVTVDLPSPPALRPDAPSQRTTSAPPASGGSVTPPAMRSRSGDLDLLADRPLRRVVLGRRFHLLAQLLARPVADPVSEHRPLDVVRLVLQAPGQQPVALVGDVLAGQTLTGDPGPVGAGTVHERARVGQAALLAVVEPALTALGELDDGVAHHAAMGCPGLVGTVEDEHGQVDPDLAGREADPDGGVHRGDHVGHQARSSSSYDVTGRAGRCITSAPQRTTGRTVPPVGSATEVGETGASGEPDMPGILGVTGNTCRSCGAVCN